jgi:1-acyl-sn-glycerol-3-phosphate acyltransferase
MKREIIFKPVPSSQNHASLFYTAKMVTVTLIQSLSVIWDASFRHTSISFANKHIKNFGQSLLRSSHTTLEVVGRSKIDFNQSYIYMSNHPSMLDIPALFEAIPQSLRMVTKDELFQIPIFGQALTRSGFIRINRRNREKAIAQLEIAKERLKDGISVWISPEGTRSRTAEMGPFKKGGFHIATNLGVPIVPIWIEGTAEILKPGSFFIHPNRKTTLFFGTPIQTAGLERQNLAELMTQVRQKIEELRPILP